MSIRTRSTPRARLCAVTLGLLAIQSPSPAQLLQPNDVIAVSETATSATLRVYDSSGTLKATFSDPLWSSTGNGRYLDIAPDGTLWVGDRTSNRLFHYDRNLTLLEHRLIPCINGGGFAFDNAGRVVITAGQDVVTLDLLSGAETCCVGVAGAETWGIDVLPNGNVALSLHTAQGLVIVDPLACTQLQGITCSQSMGRCWSVVAVRNDLVLASDWEHQFIRALDPTLPGGSQCLWSIPLNGPQYPHTGGLAVNAPIGQIVVAVYRNAEYWLERYDLSTQALIGVPTRMQPTGASLTPPCNIVVVPGADPLPVTAVCFGDGSQGSTPCPCANSGGIPGHGCENMLLTGGGRLQGTGVPSVTNDTLQLVATSLRPSASVLFFQAAVIVPHPTFGTPGTSFGNGLRCIGGSIVRLGAVQAQNGNAWHGNPPFISVAGGASAFEALYYQAWYRDAPAWCPQGGPWNLTNALRIVWQP
jgi:hypothetical protein